MKIAIVTDTVPKPRWSEDWKRLCEENSIEFQEFDSYDPDFISQLLDYRPYRVLWRSGNHVLTKVKDESLRQILDKTKLKIIPDWKTHWIYDHKVRQTYLFKSHDIPHPETWIFFREKDAMDFVKYAEYPFVIKSDGGAGGKSFRFVEDKKTARDIISNTFKRRGKWTGHEYENHVSYIQEYIPIDGKWRVCMFEDNMGFAYYVNVDPETKRSDAPELNDYEKPVPIILFNIVRSINRHMGWNWMLYDIIWDDKRQKHLILEVTDTCGHDGNMNRRLTYYRVGERWVPKEENTPIQELIFRFFVLENRQNFEAPGC